MSKNATLHPIAIDLNEFKLHIALKKRIELTLHFNSPSRRFYLCVIALVVNEMKKLGKVTPVPLEGHIDLLALLNDTIGGSAGSSEKKSLSYRIYRKWQHALPNLEEAPLFTVLGRKKGYEEGTGKSYHVTEAERDSWANLFEYKGSYENARLKFAVDKIGAGLDDIAILYEGSQNTDAWERFISSLTGKEGERQEPEPDYRVSEGPVPEGPQVAAPPLETKGASVPRRYPRAALMVAIVVVLGTIALAIWETFLKPAPIGVASIERMAYPLPDRPSIAVLPFANIGGDPEQEYFSDGMTDDLITDLSKISGLFVIARNSTFSYKGKSVKLRQVAEDLGVRYVLEGSVRRTGEQLRINAQLVDATTGHHLWAERYDGSMKEVFALQDKINQRIVAALSVRLKTGEKELVAHGATDNVEAYDALLKGWGHQVRFTPEDFDKAIRSFERAVELDPGYGQAHAALAMTYWMSMLMPRLFQERGLSWWFESRLRARKYLREAMKNPTSLAHHVNAEFCHFQRQHEEAISELQKALALDPNNPGSHALMSRVLSLASRPKEAIDFARRGMRLDPHNPILYLINLSTAEFCMGHLEEAAALAERVLRLNPEIDVNLFVSIDGLLGREERARAALDNRRKSWWGENLGNVLFAWPFKDRALADRFLEGLAKAGMPGRPSDHFYVSKEDQFTQQDLRALAGSTVVGLNAEGSQWSFQLNREGDKGIYRGPPWSLGEGGPWGLVEGTPWTGEDTARVWYEGDSRCLQYEKTRWGLVSCEVFYRNPRGTPERKDEFVIFSEFGTFTCSPVR
jgi:adenylate cyclase